VKRVLRRLRGPALALLLALLAIGPVMSAPTTGVKVVAFDPNGSVLAELTVDYRWMEANLPVLGDGKTHYYHQGPVFTNDTGARWDPGETTNFKDHGAVKCSDLADLADIVGGMEPSDEVMVHAGDGYNVLFKYPNVVNPQPRQGPVGICWYNGEETAIGERQGVGYPPDYYAGMRLTILADTSTNTEGKHVFGNTDMREVMPPEDVHLFDDLYPSTNGLSVKWIDEIRVYRGGYTGARQSLVKSLTEGSATEPAPAAGGTPEAIPLPAILAPLAAAGVALLSRRRRG
jgi:hypothetical protein